MLFHLHGNTEHAGREYAGWRQHKETGPVRDVERDRIAQQIEAAKSPQLVGILPMGVNQSQFGAISPDTYIRDAFDRLAEIGAWKAAPKQFRVALSAHSGGGFTVEKMMHGRKGFQLPQNLGMIILFEANNNLKSLKSGEQQAFTAWALGQLNAHLAVLTSTSRTDKQKRDHLAQATRLRAFFDPRRATATSRYTCRCEPRSTAGSRRTAQSSAPTSPRQALSRWSSRASGTSGRCRPACRAR